MALWYRAVLSDTSVERERVYLPFLDGMRALAAMYVVAVFLVISGCCLMLPIARQPIVRLERGFAPFALRRANRLLPAYFVVLIATIMLIIIVPSLRSPSGTPWDITRPTLTFGTITSHVFGIHNWVESWQWSINPPMWSIALELQIYAVLAVVLLPLVRSIGSRRMVVVVFAVSLVLLALGLGFAHPWMLGLFAVGVVAAEMPVAGRQRSSRDRVWLVMFGLAVVGVSAAREPIRSQDIQSLVSEVVVGFATAVIVVVLASRGGTGTDGACLSMARALSWGPPRAVGARRRAPVIVAVTAAVFYAVERPVLHRPATQSASAQPSSG